MRSVDVEGGIAKSKISFVEPARGLAERKPHFYYAICIYYIYMYVYDIIM